jgi:hypothetical protein
MAFPHNHSTKNNNDGDVKNDDSSNNETKNDTKTKTKSDGSYDVVDVDEIDRCVKVSKWKDKECKELPSGSSLPSRWNEVIRSEHKVDFFIEKHERSIKICFERDGCNLLNRRVHVATMSPVTLLSNAEVRLQPRVLTTIVLESSEMDDTGLPCEIKNTPSSLENSNDSLYNDNKGEDVAPNFKFKFKDVSIVMNAPPPPSNGALEEKEENGGDDILKKDDDKDDYSNHEFDDFDDSVDSETLNEMESDFVVKVVLQEPDWDRHARIIQRCGKKWAQRRIQAASRIAKWLKANHVLDKWQELVYETITQMHCHMTIIQKWIRRLIASRHVIRKRQMLTNRMLKSIQRTVHFFVDDMSAYSTYLVSEEGNYQEFGMNALTYNLPFSKNKRNGRSLESCGVIVADTYNHNQHDKGRGNMQSMKLLPELPGGDQIVHPLDHLSVSVTTYKDMEETWNVFQRHDLAFQQQKQPEDGMKEKGYHTQGQGQRQEEFDFLDSLPSVVHRLIGKSLT